MTTSAVNVAGACSLRAISSDLPRRLSALSTLDRSLVSKTSTRNFSKREDVSLYNRSRQTRAER